MPHRKKIVVLMALWSELYPLESIALELSRFNCQGSIVGPASLRDARADRAKQHKYARLRFLAQTVGRIVDSANDLTDDELEKCIRSLQLQQRASGRSRTPNRESRVPSNLRRFPNRSGISKETIWKIREIEKHLLHWDTVPARLEGFLGHVYHVRRPDDLTHAQAWRCIESLFDVAARAEIKAEKGAAYRVPKDELAARAAQLKVALQSRSLKEGRYGEADRSA